MGHRWWVGVLDDAHPRVGLKPAIGIEPTYASAGVWSSRRDGAGVGQRGSTVAGSIGDRAESHIKTHAGRISYLTIPMSDEWLA